MGQVRLTATQSDKRRAVRLAQEANKLIKRIERFQKILEFEKAAATSVPNLLDEFALLGTNGDVLDAFEDVCGKVVELLNAHKERPTNPNVARPFSVADFASARTRNGL